MGSRHVQRLRLADVVQNVQADFLECRPAVVLPGGSGRTVELDEGMRARVEDYVNAAHRAAQGPPPSPPPGRLQGRPFLDYRPDIGQHLFPSPVTGGGLSRRTVRRHRMAAAGDDKASTTSHAQ